MPVNVEAELLETAAPPGLISKGWWSEQSGPTSHLRVRMLRLVPANPGRIRLQERGLTDDCRRSFELLDWRLRLVSRLDGAEPLIMSASKLSRSSAASALWDRTSSPSTTALCLPVTCQRGCPAAMTTAPAWGAWPNTRRSSRSRRLRLGCPPEVRS